ncbi:putative signal transducing protein [Chryseolinea lacunae]|uniref:DUF2007 domain-containing protein n=1 Tax=Chryseolinea lacunae TaxID=2801331 RepID=A0ABS1KT05_9BACT|nr:DUF2007 domain-containing protein [Chryseolinea lacunae]MBL0742575.1 DUF2007 domain-containing protein [Chryseolinea lacunae]
MSGPETIIAFRQFDNAIEANIAKAKLDAYGIACFLTEENMANLYPGAHSMMIIHVRLHLFAHDAERAGQLLEEQNLMVDDTGNTCPQCFSKNVVRDFPNRFNMKITSLLNVVFFGIFFPHEKVFRCGDCNHEFDE